MFHCTLIHQVIPKRHVVLLLKVGLFLFALPSVTGLHHNESILGGHDGLLRAEAAVALRGDLPTGLALGHDALAVHALDVGHTWDGGAVATAGALAWNWRDAAAA